MRAGTSVETEWTWELQDRRYGVGFAGKGTVIETQGIFRDNRDVPDKDSHKKYNMANKGGTAKHNLSPLRGLRDFFILFEKYLAGDL